jgi:hypothetical protein
LRFPIFASLAYGAQGIWYFTYRGPLSEHRARAKPSDTYEDALSYVTPNWHVAKNSNLRVAAWGPRLLGRQAVTVFNTGWTAAGTVPPRRGSLVEWMSDDLLVGILAAAGKPPLAMIVDKRVHKQVGATPEREVEVRFSRAVTGGTVIQTNGTRAFEGVTVRCRLLGGQGQLVELKGDEIVLPEGGVRVSAPIVLATPGAGDARAVRTRWISTSPVPVAVRGAFRPHANLEARPAQTAFVLPPHGSQTVDFVLRPAGSAAEPGAVDPVSMRWTSACRMPDGSWFELGPEETLSFVPPIGCPRLKRPVVVDGSLDDWPELPFVCRRPAMIKLNAETWKGPEDASFRFGVGWDDHNVYVALDVIDDHLASKPGVVPWGQDAIELRLDARQEPWRSLGRGCGDVYDFPLFGISPGDTPTKPITYARDFLPDGAAAASAKTAGGYTLEISVPHRYLNKQQNRRWEYFRLNIAQSDYDGPDSPGPGAAHIWWKPDWRTSQDVEGSGTFRRQ